jgi:glycine/D-amino acid oxidase-like deaminating enzyme
VPSRPLSRSISADVLVVGAGISGALVSDTLSDAGHRVVVVDRRRPVGGSTPASTALLQYEIDTPLIHLAKRIGRKRAERIWRRSLLVVDALRVRTRHLGIRADAANHDSLYLQGSLLGARELKAEADARRRAGFEVTYLDARQVRERFGISGRAAILGYDNLGVDPRRLASGFLRAAAGRGARVYAPVEVTEVVPHRHGVSASTAAGPTIRARHLVFAIGYERPRGVPRMGHTISSTWALATRPQPRALWPGRCFIWEASDPYLYLRVGPEGRVICGGEDEDLSDEAVRDALLPAKIAALERKLAALLPDIDAHADYAWAGSFGTSSSGTPSIGPVPGMPHCYAVLGYGGNGITFSMLAAQIIRAHIAGAPDPDHDLFSFSRRVR